MFTRYFGYSSPSNMFKALNETESSDENKAPVYTIGNKLTSLIRILKSRPTSDMKKIKNRNTCWKLSNVLFTLIN